MFQTKVVEKIKANFLCSVSFFLKNRAGFEETWKKYCIAKQAIDGNIMLLIGFACWIPKTTNTPSEYVLQCCSLALHAGYPRLQTHPQNMYCNAAHCLCMLNTQDYKHTLRICIAMLLIGFACWVPKTTNTPSEYVLQCCSLALNAGYPRLQTHPQNMYCNAAHWLCMLDTQDYKHTLRICIAILLIGFACWIPKTTNTHSEYVLQCCSLALHAGYLRLQTRPQNIYCNAAHCLCMLGT